jgi:tRNA pseudouridine synthase 10
MPQCAWRKIRFAQAMACDDLQRRARTAVAGGPLCDACLGRLFAQVDTGLTNAARARMVRETLALPPADGPCVVCAGFFDAVEAWVVRARQALDGWEFDTLVVSSQVDPGLAERETALWDRAGGDLAEPYKTAFNRTVGCRLCETLGCEADLVHPDIRVVADHRDGTAALRVEPLLVKGRYRKLVRGMPQCRWRAWPTSVQQILGDPIAAAARARDHVLHGCGREDTDVRCLGERPFILEVIRPRRRRLDWAALTRTIGASGKVEVVGLTPCKRPEVARLKQARPEKTYRALAHLARDVDAAHLANLDRLVGVIHQRTPRRVLKRRADRVRRRRVCTLEWRQTGPRDVELDVRAEAGTYIKELVSGDDDRTRPSVAQVLGTAAACTQLDVLAIHVDA